MSFGFMSDFELQGNLRPGYQSNASGSHQAPDSHHHGDSERSGPFNHPYTSTSRPTNSSHYGTVPISQLSQEYPINKNHLPSSMRPPQRQSTAKEAKTSNKSKQAKWDWDKHHDEIKKLYMDEESSLDETMDFMKKEFGFFPS